METPTSDPTTDAGSRIAALEATVELLQDETEQLRRDAASARRRADRLRVELDVVLGSKLWRLAEMLRSIVRWRPGSTRSV